MEQPRKTLYIGSGTRSRAKMPLLQPQVDFFTQCRMAEEMMKKRREQEKQAFKDEIDEFKKQHPIATEIHTPRTRTSCPGGYTIDHFQRWKELVLELESMFGNTLPESFKSIRIPQGTYSYDSSNADDSTIEECHNGRIRYKINHLKEIDLRKIEERKKKIEEEAIRRFCIERDRIENEIKQKKWEDGKEERERQFKEKQEKQKKEKEEFEKAVEAKLNEWHPKLPKLEPVVEKIESKPQQPPYKIPPFKIEDYPIIRTAQEFIEATNKYNESVKDKLLPTCLSPEFCSKLTQFTGSKEYKDMMDLAMGFGATTMYSQMFVANRLQKEFIILNQ